MLKHARCRSPDWSGSFIPRIFSRLRRSIHEEPSLCLQGSDLENAIEIEWAAVVGPNTRWQISSYE